MLTIYLYLFCLDVIIKEDEEEGDGKQPLPDSNTNVFQMELDDKFGDYMDMSDSDTDDSFALNKLKK